MVSYAPPVSSSNSSPAAISGAPGTQPAQLVRTAEQVQQGVSRLPWDDTSHRRRCVLCRDHADQLDEVEAAYLGWQPAQAIADELGVSVSSIRSHAAAYLWDLRRCAELAPAYSHIVEAGIEAARAGKATPAHALQAMRDLARAARRGPGPRAGDEEAGTSEVLETDGGAVVISYEERVRRTRAELRAGVDPAELARQIAKQAAAVAHEPVDELAELELPDELPPGDELARQASALLGLGDGTIRSRREAAKRLVKASDPPAEATSR